MNKQKTRKTFDIKMSFIYKELLYIDKKDQQCTN